MSKSKITVRIVAGAVCALGSAGAALAADLPVKAPPLAASVYNWTGVYGGIHGGYGQGTNEWTNSTFAYDSNGFLGGGQIGVNQQIGNWVIGLEADASWANIKGDQSVTVSPGVGMSSSVTTGTTIDRLATVTGRLGFAQDRWLIYVKGGGAWAHEKHDYAIVNTGAGGGLPDSAALTASDNRFGWVFGIGSEVALWGNWSFKSEYNYIQFKASGVTLSGTQTIGGVTTPFGGVVQMEQALHVAKFGVNYRFGPDAPPAIAPSRPAPGYNWTGAWLGVQAGYGFGRTEWPTFAPGDRFDVDGFFAGGTSGASVQAGVFVVGAESEWLWTNLRGSGQSGVAVPGAAMSDMTSRADWLSLNSVRVGFVAADRWQVYAKGGLALAHETHDLNLSFGTSTFAGSGSGLHTGALAGVGVEYAFLGNWSAKLEYNYINFGQRSVLVSGVQTIAAPPVAGIAAAPVSTRQDLHLVKFGINYHFHSFLDLMSGRL